MRYCILLTIWCLAQSSLLAAQAPSKAKSKVADPEPLAIVFAVTGKPMVRRGTGTLQATKDLKLQKGDAVSCPTNPRSEVVIWFSDARRKSVKPGDSLTIAESTKRKHAHRGLTRSLEIVRDIFLRDRRPKLAAVASRGDDEKLRPLEAVQPNRYVEIVQESEVYVTGRVIATSPVFIFTPTEKKSSSYRLRIVAADGKAVFDRELSENELSYDSDDGQQTGIVIARPHNITLPSGKLEWQVAAGNGRTQLTPFESVDSSQKALSEIVSATAEVKHADGELIRGCQFEAEGFLADAIVCYQNAIREAARKSCYRVWLAGLYDRVEAHGLADRELNEVLRTESREN